MDLWQVSMELAKLGQKVLMDNDLEMYLRRADRLAKLQALWGDAQVVNKIPAWIEAVSSADVQRVAATYLTKANRSVIDRKPAAMLAAPAAAPAAAASKP